MIYVTYNYECDVCGLAIRAPELYTIRPFSPARDTAVFQPEFRGQVGQLHVCGSCEAIALAALKEIPRASQG